MEMELDEDTLREIAQLTDGEYFRATAAEDLAEIYDRIDELEKTKIETKTFTSYTDRFSYFIIPALALLLFQLGLGESALREIP
jgi:Ca-activated chloride channel family protein